MIRILAFLCLSVSLYADIEYEIRLLEPNGQKCTDSDTVFSYNLNETGYIWSTFSSCSPTIYHESFGTKTVPNKDEQDTLKIECVNNQGIAVGTFLIPGKDKSYTTNTGIFIYNAPKEDFYELSGYESKSFKNVTITDSNEIIFEKSDDSRIFSYNLDNRSEKTYTCSFFKVNTKGQMIGCNEDLKPSKEIPNGPWYFDLDTYHSLGSLDKFNRWNVQPKVFSESGFVAGIGLNTRRELKIFIWHPSSGLQESDLPEENVHLTAINDKGQLLGFIAKRRSYARPFILCPKFGFIDLTNPEMIKKNFPSAINNNGQVIGMSGKGNARKAYIWDLKQGMRSLKDLISEKEKGWKELHSAKVITDSGYILGTGSYKGVERYFLLTPIMSEPSKLIHEKDRDVSKR